MRALLITSVIVATAASIAFWCMRSPHRFRFMSSIRVRYPAGTTSARPGMCRAHGFLPLYARQRSRRRPITFLILSHTSRRSQAGARSSALLRSLSLPTSCSLSASRAFGLRSSLRCTPHGKPLWKAFDSVHREASNHAMERTRTARAFTFGMASIVFASSRRALSFRRRSSCSR